MLRHLVSTWGTAVLPTVTPTMVVTTRTTVAIVTVTAVEALLATTRNVTTILTAVMAVTNMFCSGAVVLPDKAARILNVGGWSLTSTFGIRLYAPDGSAGVNGTNDWEESPDTLQLQVRLPLYHVSRCSISSRSGWTLVSLCARFGQWQCPRYGR